MPIIFKSVVDQHNGALITTQLARITLLEVIHNVLLSELKLSCLKQHLIHVVYIGGRLLKKIRPTDPIFFSDMLAETRKFFFGLNFNFFLWCLMNTDLGAATLQPWDPNQTVVIN